METDDFPSKHLVIVFNLEIFHKQEKKITVQEKVKTLLTTQPVSKLFMGELASQSIEFSQKQDQSAAGLTLEFTKTLNCLYGPQLAIGLEELMPSNKSVGLQMHC